MTGLLWVRAMNGAGLVIENVRLDIMVVSDLLPPGCHRMNSVSEIRNLLKQVNIMSSRDDCITRRGCLS
jgi:hypothetical protein